MIERLDVERARLELSFDDAHELDDFVQRTRKGRSVVRLEERVDEGCEIELVLRSEGTRWTVPARVRQVFRSGTDRFGTMLDVLRWDAPKTVDPAPPDGAGPAPGDVETDATETESTETESTETDSTETDSTETMGTSIQFEIRSLNPTQRALLAAKANRIQRQILLRESSPQVQQGLLNNPGLETKEVLELAKNAQTVTPVLQRIAAEHRYVQNSEIRVALVKNPNTPTPLALRLLEGLQTQDLRVLAKSGAVREAVRGAALRVYLRRM